MQHLEGKYFYRVYSLKLVLELGVGDTAVINNLIGDPVEWQVNLKH